MNEQQRHSTSDSSSGGSSSSSGSSAATGAMAAAAPPSLSIPSAAAPRSTLQRILSTTLHDDPTLSAIQRALPPLPLPPEPQPPNPMLLMQQRTGAGGSAGGVGAGAGAAAATASTVLGANATSLPPSPLPFLSAPIVSVEAVLAAVMAATAAEGSGAAAAAFAPFPLQPPTIARGPSAAAAATHPVSAVPLAAIPVAASVVTAASTGRARSPGDAAAAGEEANAKESLIQSMLKRPPFGALGDKHYCSTVLRHYLHELPLAQLFQLAWHWSFYCDYRLDELKDEYGRPVSTPTRAWILRVDPKGKGRGMRPFVFLTNLLQEEISKKLKDATLAQQGHRLVQTDMDPRIELVLQRLVGRFLLPATLLAEFHVVIRDAVRYPSAAVAFLQQLIREAGVDLDKKEFKWSLVYLVEQACDLALPPARAVAITGHLCNLLLDEGVHVPMQPSSTIKGFVLQLLGCNMLVEYSDALRFERWLRQQGHPLADLPHLLEQQTATAEASMRFIPMLAQTNSRLDSAFVEPIAVSSSCSAPSVASSQLITPAAGDAAAGGSGLISASRSNSAPLMPSMPQSLRAASDYLSPPPPLLDQAAADASMVAATPDDHLTLEPISCSDIRSSSPLGFLPNIDFEPDFDQLMDSSNPNQ